MFKKTLSFIGNAIERKITNEQVTLNLPAIHFFGKISEEQVSKAIEDISRAEEIYFAPSDKLKIKTLELALAEQQMPAPKTAVTKAAQVASDTATLRLAKKQQSKQQPDEDDAAISKARELEQRYPDARQALLREVGQTTSGIYLGSGARFIPKLQRKCFVVYLQGGKKTVFVLGTQLQECVIEENPIAGDFVKITKVGQFRKAADRSHAQAAQFKFEILEQAPSNSQDEVA